MKATRQHRSYAAFLGHRLSGLALAAFLPAHFLVLGSAMNGPEPLDRFLRLSDNLLFKTGEWLLVILLALHLLFGLRVLLLEFAEWPSLTDNRVAWIVPATIVSLAVGALFLLQL